MDFAAGDPALLIDSKGRHFLLKLDPDRTFQYHQGSIAHRDLIGQDDGSWVESSSGGKLLLLRPRLADYVLKMKRSAQVVYPKDLGPILVYADIAPGMTILEAGTGSGALTLGLSRAVGPKGRVVSVELRDDHAAHARKTIERWYGELPANLELVIGEVAEEVGTGATGPDHPRSSRAVASARCGRPPSARRRRVLCLPPHRPPDPDSGRARDRDGRFAEIEVKEFLVRDWNVSGRSVRPEHSMIGHTGFLVFMRRVDRPPGSDAEPL